ncbi:MAG: CBS domain-containing protein [Nanoarchaeota archaeon]
MIRAKNMMTKEVIAISQNSSIMEAANLLLSKAVSNLIVVEKSAPIAVISERDVITGILLKKSKIKDVMSKNFKVINPNTSFNEISRLLRQKQITRFPVVQDNSLIGIITESDIVEATRDFTRFHQVVQDVILTVFGIATAFFLFYFSPLRVWIFG